MRGDRSCLKVTDAVDVSCLLYDVLVLWHVLVSHLVALHRRCVFKDFFFVVLWSTTYDSPASLSVACSIVPFQPPGTA